MVRKLAWVISFKSNYNVFRFGNKLIYVSRTDYGIKASKYVPNAEININSPKLIPNKTAYISTQL